MTVGQLIMRSFTEAEPEIQYYAECVVDALKQIYPAAFNTATSSLSPEYLKRSAGKLYELAEDDLELKAMYFGLNSLYEVLIKKFTSLLPAPERMPAIKQDAYFQESDVPLIIVEQIAELALADTSRDAGAALVALSILTNIRTTELLTDVVFAPTTHCFAVKERQTLIIAAPQGNFFLNAYSVAAWRFLRINVSDNGTKKHRIDIERSIKSWLERNALKRGPNALKKQVLQYSVDSLLSSLSDFYSSMVSAHFHQYASEINSSALLLAIAGERSQSADSRDTPDYEFVKALSQQSPHGTVKNNENKAYLAARKRLREYQKIARKKYKDTKKARQALRLELIRIVNRDDLSYLFRCVVIYVACVLTEGSMFKKDLKVSSILTYLSAIYALYKKLAQADATQQIEPAHFGEAIGQMADSSSLSAVFQFIAFLDHYSDIDVSELERPDVSAAGEVRAHYLPVPILTESLVAFNPEQNWSKKQCMIAALLAYYAGLRRDEVMLLKCRDIDFRTDAIYVTDEVSRKTKTSVRSIPLCLLPAELENALKTHLEKIERVENDAYVFDKNAVDLAWPMLRDVLRASSGEQNLVFHSLRHAFANNTVMLLLLASTLATKPSDFYCFQTSYFAQPQIARVKAYFAREGKALDENFDFISQVGRWLGHSSPLVSIMSYFHLFPLLTHIMQDSPLPLRLRTLVSWLYDNSYQSTQFKKLEKTSPEDAEEVIFNAAIYRETKDLRQPIKNFQIKKTDYFLGGNISFSEFVYQVSQLQKNPKATLTFNLANSGLHKLSALKKLEVPLHLTAEFNRLLARLDCTQTLNKNMNALKTLAACLRLKKITTKAHLTLVLNAYRVLEVGKGVMTLRKKPEWTELIENAGFDAELSSEEGEAGADPKLKRSTVRLWAVLSSVIDMFVLYGECVDGA